MIETMLSLSHLTNNYQPPSFLATLKIPKFVKNLFYDSVFPRSVRSCQSTCLLIPSSKEILGS
jgi:hypothetical protein